MPELNLSSVNSLSFWSSSSFSGIGSNTSLGFLRKNVRGPRVSFVASDSGLGPRARADSKGPHRLSPAATSSSHRGPIVRRLRAFGAVGAALLRETGPAAGRLGPHAPSLHALLAQGPEGGRGGQTQR